MKNFLIALPIIASLYLQACSSLNDYLANYKGSLTSPTVGDMIYLKSANDTFMFGKPFQSHHANATLTYNVLVSRYEVTNKAFGEFISGGGYTNQAYWTTAGWNFITANGITWPHFWYDLAISPDQPVVGLSWHEAVAFTQWLSLKEGWPVAYDSSGRIIDILNDGYRLPTEVEWEYAASKGDPSETERLYAWGNGWNCGKAICRVPPCDNYVSFLREIGSKSPEGDTPKGLSDMSGNASEMVSDTYCSLSSGSSINRYIFDDQVEMIIHRGGGWPEGVGGSFETSHRAYVHVEARTGDHIGFRVARTYPIQ